MFGWMGKILRVSLDHGHTTESMLPRQWSETYLGGRGLGTKILCEEMPKACDPLGPDNMLIFAPGPLTGTPVPMAGRFSASTKSPLTGTIFDSNCGGDLGIALKSCGLDALVLTGRAPAPVYVLVDEAGVTIKDAGPLWGLNTPSTASVLKEREGPASSVLTIGPGGEHLVRFACCENNGRYLGRGGLGAVMGAKKLKAVVVKRGGQKPEVANKDRLHFIVYEMNKWLEANPITSRGLPQFGTAVLMNIVNEAGILPVRNFRDAGSPLAFALSGEAVSKHILQRRKACPQCPVGCGRVTATSSATGQGPEFETLWALGANLEIYELAAVAEANYLCNSLGLDTISTGATLACAAELREKGILREGFASGDGTSLHEILEHIAYRRESAFLLGEGSLRLAETYGLPESAMHVKGLELPAYDPRGAQGQGLAYSTSQRGGCHLRAYMIGPEVLGIPKMVDRFQAEGKEGLVIYQQDINAAVDSMVMCRFSSFAVGDDYYARLLSAVCGIDYEPQDLHIIGERIWNLERLYNLREGISSIYDNLPQRLLTEAVNGRVVSLTPMLAQYRRFRGWDETGRPGKKKLHQLELTDPSCHEQAG
jgi:aldehyde:ferredoxin oxidoreductase